MKNLLFILLFFILGCTEKHTQLTSLEKENLEKETSGIVRAIVDNLHKGNLEKAMEPYDTTADFIHVANGSVKGFKAFEESNRQAFEMVEKQQYSNEKFRYSLVDKDQVVMTWTAVMDLTFKNGLTMKADPFTATLIFKKKDGEWKIVYSHESSSIKS
jgi:ketosteroid isomerase-like protein